MSLFEIYKSRQLGAGAGSLFDAKAGGKLNKDAWKKGFNKWDEEWEVGRFNWTTGDTYSDSTRIRSKNYVAVRPNTTYCLIVPNNVFADVYYYDSNKKFISPTTVTSSRLFTTPDNATYIRFSPYAGYGTTYNHDICVNVSGEHNGEYLPYDG